MVSQRNRALASRARLLAAAAEEFAALGFDGAKVDRIAARARINKAMLYYHFTNKASLYREVLRDVFGAAADAVEEGARSGDPEARLRAFIAAVANSAVSRPHFPAIWLREMADGGRHLDEPVIAQMRRVMETLAGVLDAGRKAGLFRDVPPLVAQMGIVGPLLFFAASAPARERLRDRAPFSSAGLTREYVDRGRPGRNDCRAQAATGLLARRGEKNDPRGSHRASSVPSLRPVTVPCLPVVPVRSGYVEATEVKVGSKIAGRVEKVNVTEGQRVAAGDVVVTIATTDVDLALRQARAERDQAAAQLQLLQAGSRLEDVRQAEAQVAAAESDRRAAASDLAAAKTDEARFEQLLRARAGAEKARDDAVARREQAEARAAAAGDHAKAAEATWQKLRAGARPQEIAAARARVAAVDAQIATLEHNRQETIVTAPSAGIVSSRLVEPGELVAVGAPLVAILDLDRAWANAYVEEPLVPSLKIDEPATIVTDAGDRLTGRISFIAPRAEFTPRNVQTSAERAKLVYRIKVSTDNRSGVLKPGMPVEVEFTAGATR